MEGNRLNCEVHNLAEVPTFIPLSKKNYSIWFVNILFCQVKTSLPGLYALPAIHHHAKLRFCEKTVDNLANVNKYNI